MGKRRYILLSFDLEEFDIPFEYGGTVDLSDQMNISISGVGEVLKLLDKYNIRSTFYVTANFAVNNPDLVREIAVKHEIASHGYFHSKFAINDMEISRKTLESIISKPVYGFRMPRMMPIDDLELFNAGYKYNSSMNPTYLPGRYNNFFKSRRPFISKGIINFPTSVTPIIRIPLFWILFKNLPLSIFQILSKWTLKTDKCLNLYFHPWEFSKEICNYEYKLPKYIRRGANKALLNKLEQFILLNKPSAAFIPTNEYLTGIKLPVN